MTTPPSKKVRVARKVDSRHRGIVTLESHVLPEDVARDRDFAKERPLAKPEYDFVYPTGEVSAEGTRRAAAAFFGPKPTTKYSSLSSPAIERLNALPRPHPAQMYSYGKRDYASVEDARRANPDMPVISNPPSAESEYQVRRDRAFIDSIGSGALGLGPMAYVMGGGPDAIQASTQVDEALGNLAGANALRPARVKYPTINPTTPRTQFKEWPENHGFTYSLSNKLRSGGLVSRYGPEDGTFVAPANTPFEARGIHPRMREDGPRIYQMIEDMDVPGGPAMPWYGGGGGWQYKLPEKVEDLIGKKLRRKP